MAINKKSLKNTMYEAELQARIHDVIKTCKELKLSVEAESAKISACVTEYFDHIDCEFIIKGDRPRGNVKLGKLSYK